MNKMIGFCGLNCETCDVYLATLHDDQELREKTAKKWSEMNQTTILPEYLYCEGCRADGVKTFFCSEVCEIRKCAVKKGMTTCGDCGELETCETVSMITAHAPEAMENLKKGR